MTKAEEFKKNLAACSSYEQADQVGRDFVDVFAMLPNTEKQTLRAHWKGVRDSLPRDEQK